MVNACLAFKPSKRNVVQPCVQALGALDKADAVWRRACHPAALTEGLSNAPRKTPTVESGIRAAPLALSSRVGVSKTVNESSKTAYQPELISLAQLQLYSIAGADGS